MAHPGNAPRQDGTLPEEKSLRDVLSIPRYSATAIRNVKNAPGAWDSLEVGVFLGEKQIGSYTRNYHQISGTFFPFESNGKWYALISRDYERTELMALPSCEVIGGEPPVEGEGFCPVHFYVPNYVQVKFASGINDGDWCYDPQADVDHWKTTPAKGNQYEFHHFNFGLVAGCVWGDDDSWKVQHLDLSRVADGVVTRSEKFGYVSLGRNCTLENSTEVIMFSPEEYRVVLAIQKTYYVNSGEAVDYSKYGT